MFSEIFCSSQRSAPTWERAYVELWGPSARSLTEAAGPGPMVLTELSELRKLSKRSPFSNFLASFHTSVRRLRISRFLVEGLLVQS